MKNVILKTKKLEQIIYNQGYICIDSHYLIKADLNEYIKTSRA
jgi:hypothetical protein